MLLNIIKEEYEYLSDRSYCKFGVYLRGILMYLRDPKFSVLCQIHRITICEPYSFKRKRISNSLMQKSGIEIGDECIIGKGLKVEHYNGIVIGKKAVIGDNCTLYQQVTIGKKNNAYPVIGNNVIIYPGAKVLGNIHIGDGAVIGTNAVVLKDVEPYTTVGGVPSKGYSWKTKHHKFVRLFV